MVREYAFTSFPNKDIGKCLENCDVIKQNESELADIDF